MLVLGLLVPKHKLLPYSVVFPIILLSFSLGMIAGVICVKVLWKKDK